MIHVFSGNTGSRELRDTGRMFADGASGLFEEIAGSEQAEPIILVFNFSDIGNAAKIAEILFEFLELLDTKEKLPVSSVFIAAPPGLSFAEFTFRYHRHFSTTFRSHCFIRDETDYPGFLKQADAGAATAPIVCFGKIGNYSLKTFVYRSCLVHDVKVTGPINLQERIPLYEITLSFHEGTDFYCILDNSGGHENVLDLEGIRILDDMLIQSGIATFFGVTVSSDPGYDAIVRLTRSHAEMRDLDAELYHVADRDDAWTLLEKTIAKRQAPGTAS